ncbi:MAG: metal ABC transporter permease [Planctomycetes bacterium]|nr:metal ABC transporter permease [Planctomycetota bacterium]
MIREFIDSWFLFSNSYIAGWCIAAMLALIGVIVVARDQIFIGAAISQSATCGIALGLWLANAFALAEDSWWTSRAFHGVMSGTFAVLAALLTSFAGRSWRETHESITGWLFLFTGGASILLVAHTPHGLEEVHRLMASSIIGATMEDTIVLASALALSAFVLWRSYRPVLLVVTDPEMARANGLRVPLWEAGIAIGIGLLIGLALRVSGMTYTFACLVLPALIAKHMCREIRGVFLAAPPLALVASFLAFLLAHRYDAPPAQVTVVLLSLALAAVWLVRFARGMLSR